MLRPVALLALLSEQTRFASSQRGRLLPGFRRFGRPLRRRISLQCQLGNLHWRDLHPLDHRLASLHHTDTIASFTQGIFLPEFALAQQDVLKKIGELVRHRQIDFPSDPAFSERFHLVGSDEDGVRELFTPDMREFMTRIEPEWRIEASGHTPLMYQAGYTVKPEEFSDFVDETTEIAKNFFSHCHLKKPAF